MELHFWLAVGIFIASYIAICFESFHGTHKAVIALCGAALVMGLEILTQNEAFYSVDFGVDWNVVFLLIAMMIIVNIMKPTGVFEYLAIKCAKIGKGEAYRIMAIFAIVTALISAFLDNVTTVLLIAPVILFVTKELKINPIPFLISTALASNIGGTATLIGDPPNVMIASKAGLTFMDFVVHLTPVIILIMAVYVVMIRFIFHKSLIVSVEAKDKIMQLDEKSVLKDKGLAKKSLIVLGVMILCFVFHDKINLHPATIALLGAGVIFMISDHAETPHTILGDIEWTSIFFFIGLFIIIGAVVKVGFISLMAKAVISITGANIFKTSIVILWFSSIASAIIDNIPYVATLNPMIIDMARQIWPNVANPEIIHKVALLPVWWSLALGACLGGNGTIIGASANVVVAGIAEKNGYKISFLEFMKYAIPVWFMTILVSHLYIWLRYFCFAKP
jgi:Na+/H+ antiporter NhaD/arsenite permease-like protein